MADIICDMLFERVRGFDVTTSDPKLIKSLIEHCAEPIAGTVSSFHFEEDDDFERFLCQWGDLGYEFNPNGPVFEFRCDGILEESGGTTYFSILKFLNRLENFTCEEEEEV